MTNVQGRVLRCLGAALVASVTTVAAAGCGGGSSSSSSPAHGSPPSAVVQSSTLVASPAHSMHPANPYRVLAITRKEVEAKDFVLGVVPRNEKVRLTKRDAIRVEVEDFPSRMAPRRITSVLIRYEALSRKLNPPYRRFVPVWAIVLGFRLPGSPIVVSAHRVPTWTVVMINANTGKFQELFVRRGTKPGRRA
jgi:hypothetical protein